MRVTNIEKTDKYIDMYDVLNTKNKRFVANNLILHNSAADMTKKALIAIENDAILNKLRGYAIIPVHDEIILHAPLRYARVVSDRFAHVMSHAADDVLKIPISCDVVTFEKGWNSEPMELDIELAGLSDEFNEK